MSSAPGCARMRLVDLHFSGRLSARQERVLRTHLPECAICRRRYDRQLLLAEVMPGALPDRERIGKGLGFRGARPVGWGALRLRAVAAVAVWGAALLVVPKVMSPARPDPAVTVRGEGPASAPGTGDAALSVLEIYRVSSEGRMEAASRVVHSGDELAFAYRNPGNFRFLMVLGVHSNGLVYGYHPRLTEPGRPPVSVPIMAEAGLHELPETRQPLLPPGEVEVIALFSLEPLAVTQVEERLREQGVAGLLGQGGFVESHSLEVRP